MKRILALDGGGIRGIFSLKILLRMQQILRGHYNNPALLLRDHFDFFAGTSTGAIIAAYLAWGRTVEEILDLYVRYGREMFQPIPWYNPYKRYLVSRFDARPLSDRLKQFFSEDAKDENGEIIRDANGNPKCVPSLLGTEMLRAPNGELKLLLVVVRNRTTGSAWPLTNNPFAKYNQWSDPQCNLQIPLYKLVRASTAAPVYFDPEEIDLGPSHYVFVDGSITPYNNPALIAALTAILPCYNLNWETGPDRIRLISLGTMRFPSGLPKKAGNLWVGYNASRIPAALIQGAASEQDYLCRALGECIYGEPVDGEVGDLCGVPLPGKRWFSYVRYNRSYKSGEVTELLRNHPELVRLDAIRAIPIVEREGDRYAAEHVKLEHLI